ncbi:MAG TPA: methyltransferase domain-containing protein [Egibacteraceae bacterium]|nr:methyltransferase domain-containing protein [Egibacteraceae bacterium]
MDTRPISTYFDRGACCQPAENDDVELSGVSRRVLDALDGEGLQGRSVLEIGCGTGRLSLAAVGLGAAHVTGIDLSPLSIEAARQRAERAGVSGRTRFEAGDGSQLPSERHDLVVLDKVVCCYPDGPALVARACAAAGRAAVLSLPPSSGPRGAAARVAIAGENLARWIRRDPFRAYVHQIGRVHAAALGAGLRPARSAAGLVWDVMIYRRPA